MLYLTPLLSGLLCLLYVCFCSGNVSSFLISWPDTEGTITQHRPDIHIFLLCLVCSAFQVDVIVELQPLEDDALLYRDVVLLLKCAKSVNWVIQAHGLVGKLDIVVSS